MTSTPETGQTTTLPADFLMSYVVSGRRLTGTDLAIWLTSIARLPEVDEIFRTAAVDAIEPNEDGVLVAKAVDVPRPLIAAAMGRMSNPRYHDAVGRLKASKVRMAGDMSAWAAGVPMLIDHSMRDPASRGAHAIEVMHVHPWLAAQAGSLIGVPMVSLDIADLNKLSSRHSVLLYSRLRASTATAWDPSIDVSELGRNAGIRIRVPYDRVFRWLGFDIMLSPAQIDQTLEIVQREFFKIGYKVTSRWLMAGKEHAGLQISIVPLTVKQALRDMEMSAHADMISSGIGAELAAKKRSKTAA